MLRFLTSGESHGQALIAIIDGIPAGLPIDIAAIRNEMHRRQQGYGRGNRQKIEKDDAELIGGVRHGVTTGAPVALMIKNRDFENWQNVMSSAPVDLTDPAVQEQFAKKSIEKFRPGHADLAGTLKFHQTDIRNVLERASARETAARVAVGAVCEQLLRAFGVTIASHVRSVGPIAVPANKINGDTIDLAELMSLVDASEMFCADAETTDSMRDHVKEAWQEGDSVGGVVEVLVDGLPVGLGSYTQWDERLDGQLAQAVMSIQAMKAVEIGDGVDAASAPGSEVHDALFPAQPDPGSENVGLPFRRATNHAGGIEGGMTNGSRLRLRAYMKPIPTMRKGLPSVSFPGLTADTAHYERSDVCAVPAASVVVKAMTSFVLARAMLNKFGSDSMDDIRASVGAFKQYCAKPFAAASTILSEFDRPEMELE
ncbi:MAG: chorismate synthase [Candidatus Obscuribacterales bacterium]|nr:chorismate synthase [Candidatus Obscuribacterales bacterium]